MSLKALWAETGTSRLSLVAANRGYFLVAGCGLLIVVVSLVAVYGL